jgi:hypothetical protein
MLHYEKADTVCLYHSTKGQSVESAGRKKKKEKEKHLTDKNKPV